VPAIIDMSGVTFGPETRVVIDVDVARWAAR
jgi:hypothetical protein